MVSRSLRYVKRNLMFIIKNFMFYIGKAYKKLPHPVMQELCVLSLISVRFFLRQEACRLPRCVLQHTAPSTAERL